MSYIPKKHIKAPEGAKTLWGTGRDMLCGSYTLGEVAQNPDDATCIRCRKIAKLPALLTDKDRVAEVLRYLEEALRMGDDSEVVLKSVKTILTGDWVKG